MARSRKNTDKPDDTTESFIEKTDAAGTDTPGMSEIEDAEVIEEIGAGERPAGTESADRSEGAGDEAEAAAEDHAAVAETADPTAAAAAAEPGADGADGDRGEDAGTAETAAPEGAAPGGDADAAAPEEDETPETVAGEPELVVDPEAPPAAGDTRTADTAPEAETGRGATAIPAVAPAPVRPRTAPGTIVPLVIGGIVAGLIGYGAAWIGEWRAAEPAGPTPEENAAAIRAQSDRLAELQDAVAALQAVDLDGAVAAAASPLSDRIDDVTLRLDALSGDLARIEERVETIAMRPTATGIEADEFDSALAEFRDQLNAAIANARTEIEAARAEAARISEEAFSAEQAATARAAWEQVRTALESGAPYAESLRVVSEVLEVEPDPALAAAAPTGVETLAGLQADFPETARAALDAAIRAETGDAPLDRLTSFLRVQSGMRSLSPREGDDADAVLSRIEAALREGDLARVLAEADSLPEPGRAALDDWLERVRVRLAAVTAAATLSDQLNSN